ncbi:Lrp/AsnC family transcriptional regulator [Spiractinospora alimapuensis]|uniref:Lrp/AsnC family transcriptional regulator n=1 Tax=Spiractinospora alimapuensis TaxID=2820884 RepID=UPI001F2D7058|nr:Lrp/AsnC family transcriptional regulator [Spiractinospora alimapuensis]QVQ52135.1 Lrp/AsnC family transcriptional regulator [Spiractinospora alimapuensis]
MTLDPLDERIIGILGRDGRRSYARIGHEVGLSAPAVKRRVDRLLDTGAITGFTVVVDETRLGWQTDAYVELYCTGQPQPGQLARDVGRVPEVVSACTVTGDADALLRIRARDVRDFERVLDELAQLDYVARTKTTLVLSHLVDRPRPDSRKNGSR